MAMRRYGKGDLCGITAQTESAYGTANEDKTHMGVMTGLKIDPGITTEEQPECGSRLMGTQYMVGRDCTAKVDLKISKEAEWLEWFKWALGTDGTGNISGLQNTPTGRTVLFKVAPQSYDRLAGAYINDLTITSDKIGAPLKFSATIYAKEYQENIDAEGEPLAGGTPLRSTQGWSCNNSGIGTINAGEWTLTITQNLEKVPGADADEITNESGQEPYMGSPEITLEITTPARTRAIDTLRNTLTTGLIFTTQIGGHAVTVSGGVLESEGTQRARDPYNETITVKATNISII